MPSNKPRLQILVEKETYQKLKEICKKEERSESYIGKKAIEQYIKMYEKESAKCQQKDLKS